MSDLLAEIIYEALRERYNELDALENEMGSALVEFSEAEKTYKRVKTRMDQLTAEIKELELQTDG